MGKIFLLVDDDTDDMELFCEALNETDATSICHCATDGKQAFELLQTINKPDVIFLDINMPVINGWDCLTKLKSMPAYKAIPVIMYSTSAHRHETEMAAKLGADGYVCKPSDFKELKSILQSVIEQLNSGTTLNIPLLNC